MGSLIGSLPDLYIEPKCQMCSAQLRHAQYSARKALNSVCGAMYGVRTAQPTVRIAVYNVRTAVQRSYNTVQRS